MNITKLIEDRIESTTIQNQIITSLEQHNQKRLNKRHIDELKDNVCDSIYLSKSYGMTHIQWTVRDLEEGTKTQQLLISHDIKNVIVDTVDIIDRNPAYFEGLRKRNRERQVTLNKPNEIKALEKIIQTFLDARETLIPMLENVTDKYTIIKEFDLKDGIV